MNDNFFSYHDKKGRFFEHISDSPAVLVLFSFLFVICAGTLLLMLPISTVESESTSFLGAFFTATSATCVTGLIVYDTATHFTFLGQLIILFLIQIGGLGIMTISSAFAIMLGQKLSLKSENMMQSVVGESNKVNMINLIKNIVVRIVRPVAAGDSPYNVTQRGNWGGAANICLFNRVLNISK